MRRAPTALASTMLAAALLAGCFGDDSPADATATAPPEAGDPPPAIVAPARPDALTTQPPAGAITLPPLLPRIEGDVESATRSPDGSIAVIWLVPAQPGAVVDLLAGAVAATLTVLLDERTATGGVLAFAGEAATGHYLVTPSESGTRVELRLDPPPLPAAQPSSEAPLPDSFPVERVPIFPGATVVSAIAAELPGGGTRFVVSLETARQPVEVLGFYRDVLTVAGWSLSTREMDLDGTSPDGVISLTATAGARTRVVLLLEWSPAP